MKWHWLKYILATAAVVALPACSCSDDEYTAPTITPNHQAAKAAAKRAEEQMNSIEALEEDLEHIAPSGPAKISRAALTAKTGGARYALGSDMVGLYYTNLSFNFSCNEYKKADYDAQRRSGLKRTCVRNAYGFLCPGGPKVQGPPMQFLKDRGSCEAFLSRLD